MLLHGGETPNIDDPSDPRDRPGELMKPGGHPSPGYPNNHYGRSPWTRERTALAALSRFGESARMAYDPPWAHKIQPQVATTNTPSNYSSRILNWVLQFYFW